MRLTAQLLEKVGPGLQVAIFETVWPAIPSLQRVSCDVTADGGLGVWLDWDTVPAAEERESCEYLVSEIAHVAFGPAVSIEFDAAAGTAGRPPRVLMSAAIFRELAAQVAPHRLVEGR
jgi:hypothetical protein